MTATQLRALLSLMSSCPVAVAGVDGRGQTIWRCTDHGGIRPGRWYWSES